MNHNSILRSRQTIVKAVSRLKKPPIFWTLIIIHTGQLVTRGGNMHIADLKPFDNLAPLGFKTKKKLFFIRGMLMP